MTFAIKTSKKGPRSVPVTPSRASFVLGSRPPDMRAPSMQRVKPLDGQRHYGKDAPNPAPSGFGNTGETGMS